MRKAYVRFKLDGKLDQPQEALILTGDKVLVADQEGIGVYRIAEGTKDPNTYIVNLDEDNTDYTSKDPKALYDLILCGSAASSFRWISNE